ncbi:MULTISPECIES: TetR/AcrR family transcriptional regulator [unclassified Adlercreutzia]|uniref:TetR/AcrR family transcriptional regulator n=1 Tax=unclassified Adlercreutzia TaxID=2636013 RepID=UPI0013EBC115|nr:MULTISPECIES: TetR/AcrR family transcriptional regulator [unclassified Adlercreutzia]
MPRPAGPARDTRNDILNAAMDLFATRGFAATTVKDIATRVGIKDASLYNHFKSKRAIFDAIIERELARLQTLLDQDSASRETTNDPDLSYTRSEDDLEAFVFSSYRAFFEKAGLICLRKMLTVNQFEDPRAGELYQAVFIEQPLRQQTALFDCMVSRGLFAQCNTRLAAYELHGAAFVLLSQNLSWAEAMPRLRALLRAFERAHRA